MTRTDVTAFRTAMLNDTLGNLVKITQLMAVVEPEGATGE